MTSCGFTFPKDSARARSMAGMALGRSPGDAVEREHGIGDSTFNLVAQWAPGDGEGDADVGHTVGAHLGAPEHAEVDDGTV